MNVNSSIIAKYDYVAFYFALHSSVAFLFATFSVSILDSYTSILSQHNFPQQKMSDSCQLHFFQTSDLPLGVLSSWSNLDHLFFTHAIRLSPWNFLHYHPSNFLNLFLICDSSHFFLSWVTPLFQRSTFSNSCLRKGAWEFCFVLF